MIDTKDFEIKFKTVKVSDVYETKWRNHKNKVDFEFQWFVIMLRIKWLGPKKITPLSSARESDSMVVVILFRRERFRRDGGGWQSWEMWKARERYGPYIFFDCAEERFKLIRYRLMQDEVAQQKTKEDQKT